MKMRLKSTAFSIVDVTVRAPLELFSTLHLMKLTFIKLQRFKAFFQQHENFELKSNYSKYRIVVI